MFYNMPYLLLCNLCEYRHNTAFYYREKTGYIPVSKDLISDTRYNLLQRYELNCF